MSWRDDWETTGYLTELGDRGTDRLRVPIEIERGKVLRFSIQYEIHYVGKWLPVVRYDSAHGYAHRDRLDREGVNAGKMYLGVAEQYVEIVTAGIVDIRTSWPVYRDEFFRR